MAIVDDYAGIATELRRIQAEKAQRSESADDEQWELATSHRMWKTKAGEELYRRLVRQTPRAE